MIGFSNGYLFKLSPCGLDEIDPAVPPLLLPDERIVACAKAVRDFVVFTGRRLIVVIVKRSTGRRRDLTSMPYAKIQTFSIETAGTPDLDAELELWFSELGRVRPEFKGSIDIQGIGRMLASFCL
jgi:hypothetical protein